MKAHGCVSLAAPFQAAYYIYPRLVKPVTSYPHAIGAAPAFSTAVEGI